jgi:hypothetical protein
MLPTAAVTGYGAPAIRTLGRIGDRQGAYQQALRLHQENCDLYRAINDRRGIANVLCSMGSAAEGLWQYDEARGLTEESLAIRRAICDRRGEACGLNNQQL